MADDDAALAEVDKWIRDNNAFTAQGAGDVEGGIEQAHPARLRIGPQRLRGFSAAAIRIRRAGIWPTAVF